MKKVLIIASLLMGMLSIAAQAEYENLNITANSDAGELTVSGEISGLDRNEPVKLIIVTSQTGSISNKTLVCTNEMYTTDKKSFSFTEKLPAGFSEKSFNLYLVSDNGGIYTESIGKADAWEDVEEDNSQYHNMAINIDRATGKLTVTGDIKGLERNEPVKLIILKPESENIGEMTLIGTNEMYTTDKKSFSFSETLPAAAQSGKYYIYVVSETGGIYEEIVNYLKPGDVMINLLDGALENGAITYQAEVYNDSEAAKTADVIVAAYDNNGVLLGVDLQKDYTINVGETNITDAQIKCTDGTPAKIRLFVMDSELTPICGRLTAECK